MSVVGTAQERPDSPQASFALGKQTIVRKFLVRTNSVNDGPIEVSLALGLPRLFQTYVFGSEFHPYCRCRSIVPERLRPGSKEWEVTCTYTTPPIKSGASGDGGSDGGDGEGGDGAGGDGGGTGEETDGEYENPLLAIPEVETHFETRRQPIYGCHGLGMAGVATGGATVAIGTAFFATGDSVYVSDGKTAIVTTLVAVDSSASTVTLGEVWLGSVNVNVINLSFHPIRASNGEVYLPPPEADASRLNLTITRNEDILMPHPALAIAYQDVLNVDAFWGAAPGQCKCMSITPQRQVKQLPNGQIFPYLRTTYTFQFRNFWDKQLLDFGHVVWKTAKDGSSRNAHTPQTMEGWERQVLLDGNGELLPEGDTPVFLVVRPYASLAFSLLNLPNSFQEVQ